MRPRKWMQIAAVASAMGLAGTAIANDMGASSTPIDQSSTMSSPSTNQGGAVSSPSTDQNGYPLSATSDLDRSVPAATGLSGNASSSSSSDLTGSAATANEVNGMAPSSTANDLSAPSRSDDAAAGATGGTTQGSTMESPKPAMSSGAGASAATSGHERLANTNSDNFNAWASDYASQHEGRITRQEFLDHMGQRFDQLDTQHQGSLTPYEVEEILIVTPASPASATSSMPSATGNGANADTSNSTLR